MYPKMSSLQKQEDAQPLGTLQYEPTLSVVHKRLATVSKTLLEKVIFTLTLLCILSHGCHCSCSNAEVPAQDVKPAHPI